MPNQIDPIVELFTIYDEADAEFYNDVYFGGNFRIGSTHSHRGYVVTPQYATPAQVATIRRIRLMAGLSSDGLGIRPGGPMPPKLRLPREPVEALPLPG